MLATPKTTGVTARVAATMKTGLMTHAPWPGKFTSRIRARLGKIKTIALK